MLNVENMTVRYGENTIVKAISFDVLEGQWLMLVGPNGAGKSTIVNAIAQGVPYSGNVTFGGKDVRRMKPSEFAKNCGILTQTHNVNYSFTVEEIIRLGRYSYSGGLFAKSSSNDDKAVEEAARLTGMLSLMQQSVLTLSGGELQRTFLAQLFAQNPKLLILDEPSNHLDLVYQRQIFELTREWLAHSGRAVISVVHDLSLAKKYGTHALLLHNGRIEAFDTADKVLTRANLNTVYSMDVYAWMQSQITIWKD
ncbi:MAG: ABC transporter ATP-binding protein [Eubacteriales bacterium]|nr:ABC transporter ATP-binding protein [Clostridiales bacterium]MDY5731873.1 ABC transporter ATP-binding protein [Eubacteriales bacterium]